MVSIASTILLGLADKLAGEGIEWISEAIGNKSAKVVGKVINKVKDKTGIDLLTAGKEGENLSDADLQKLREYDMTFRIKEFDGLMKDKEAARTNFASLATNGTLLTKNMGSIIGAIIILAGVLMDTFLMYHFFTADNIAKAFEQVNAIVTFIAGFYHAAMMIILTFYYGSAKTEADKNRQENIDNIRDSMKDIQVKEMEIDHETQKKLIDNNLELKKSIQNKNKEIMTLNEDTSIPATVSDELKPLFEEEPKSLQEIADMISSETYSPKL